MPRVVPEYKAEAKKRILDVATRIVLEKGYQQVRMDDIAREAGISRPTLYLYYTNKEALFLEIISNIITGVGEMAEQTIRSGNVTSFGSFFALANEQSRDQFSIVYEVMVGMPDKHNILSKIADLHNCMIHLITSLICERFPRSAELPDPEILANAMLALFIGLQVRQKLGLEPEKAVKVWETVISAPFHMKT